MTSLFIFEAWTIGVAIGLIGIGGIFLIPLVAAALGLSLESAIGTSLVTFTATGCIATAIYAATSRIDWRFAGLTSLGSLAGGLIGARLAVALPPQALSLVFAAFLLFVGISAVARASDVPPRERAARLPGTVASIALGAVVGIGSGLTGVGGPAILVPLLLVARVPATIAIAVSQPNQIAASASGAVGHLIYGHVALSVALPLIVIVGAGVIVGALLHLRFSSQKLQPIIGGACMILALWTIVRGLGAS